MSIIMRAFVPSLLTELPQGWHRACAARWCRTQGLTPSRRANATKTMSRLLCCGHAFVASCSRVLIFCVQRKARLKNQDRYGHCVYGLLQRRTQFNSKVFICCSNSHSSREKLKKANCRFIMCVQSLIPAAVHFLHQSISGAFARVRCIARLKCLTLRRAGMCFKPSLPSLYFAVQPESSLDLSALLLQVQRVQASHVLSNWARLWMCQCATSYIVQHPSAMHVYLESS
jgi:hypothetical protein